MPTYDYYCTRCDATFEFSHGMNDTPLKKHPTCAAKTCTIKKLISASPTIFKGEGWTGKSYTWRAE